MPIDLDALPPCPLCGSPLHFTAYPADPSNETAASWTYACSGVPECGYEWGNGGEITEAWTYRTAPWTAALAEELENVRDTLEEVREGARGLCPVCLREACTWHGGGACSIGEIAPVPRRDLLARLPRLGG